MQRAEDKSEYYDARWDIRGGRSSALPPCRVCGGPGDGLHYGVNTCKACKGFFHRCLLHHTAFECKKNRNCSIQHGMIRPCQFCRYRKCLTVGMSKRAIKVGRYTSAKRTRNILEVKGLKTEQTTTFPLTSSLDLKISSSAWNIQIDLPPAISAKASDVLNWCQVEIPCSLNVLCTTEEFESLASLYEDQNSVLKSLVDAHSKYLTISSLDMQGEEDISTQQKQHYETCKLHKELFGPLTSVPNHVYDQCFLETGIDLDNRQEIFAEIGHEIETAIRRLVKFVKVIPGFSRLQMSLQTSLITYACIQLILINGHHHVHSELCVLRSFTNKCFCSEEPIFRDNSESMQEYVKAARKIQAMEMTHNELVLVMAMVVMAPENSDRANAAYVEQIQWHIVQILIQELSKRFPKPLKRFAKVIDVFLHAHIVTDLGMKFFKEMEFSKYIENIPLVREMLRELIGNKGNNANKIDN